jgi:aquaporin Z
MIAQILGAFAAMQTALFLTGKSALTLFNIHSSIAQIFVMEALLTFVLAYVVLVVATTNKFKESRIFGLAIGFTIPALVLLGGPVSGGIFNPAIILGAAASILISGGQLAVDSIVAYYIPAQLLGAVLAAYAFKYFNHIQHNSEHN